MAVFGLTLHVLSFTPHGIFHVVLCSNQKRIVEFRIFCNIFTSNKNTSILFGVKDKDEADESL